MLYQSKNGRTPGNSNFGRSYFSDTALLMRHRLLSRPKPLAESPPSSASGVSSSNGLQLLLESNLQHLIHLLDKVELHRVLDQVRQV